MNPIRETIDGKLPLLLPDTLMIRQELSAITYFKTDTGKIKIASKDEIKSKIGRSPDMCDAIVFACAESNANPSLNYNFGGMTFNSGIDRTIY